MFTSDGTVCRCSLCERYRENMDLALLIRRMSRRFEDKAQTREARLEEIERQRDSVLAEYNPNLPTYEAK